MEKSKSVENQRTIGIGVISCRKNIKKAPWYANIVTDIKNCGFIYDPGTRYPVSWRWNEFHKLFSTLNPTNDNNVTFTNDTMYSGCSRLIGSWESGDERRDYRHEAFAYLYYPSTEELYCIGLYGDEARFGGIVITPMPARHLHIYRNKYLMNRWREITPLVGKWAIFLKNLYTEVTYRPGNLGAQSAALEFQVYMQQY